MYGLFLKRTCSCRRSLLYVLLMPAMIDHFARSISITTINVMYRVISPHLDPLAALHFTTQPIASTGNDLAKICTTQPHLYTIWMRSKVGS